MIKVESVRKKYGAFLAVDNVSFTVNPGEIVAFVGPNGAGKSTVLKMLSTYLKPNSGKITISDIDIVREPFAARMNIGYMPENSIAYEGMRVDKFLRFVGRAHSLQGEELKKHFDWVVDRCKLGVVLHKRVGHCSKGYHRRISMAASLIHNPSVILMDEPTHGLDPLQVLALREFIVDLKPGKAILFSSHIIQEVVAICDRILIINNGLLLADGTITDTAIKTGITPILNISTDAPQDKLSGALDLLKLGKLKNLAKTDSGDSLAELEVHSDGLAEEIKSLFTTENWNLKSISEQPLDLEGIFAELVRRSERGDQEPAQ